MYVNESQCILFQMNASFLLTVDEKAFSVKGVIQNLKVICMMGRAILTLINIVTDVTVFISKIGAGVCYHLVVGCMVHWGRSMRPESVSSGS